MEKFNIPTVLIAPLDWGLGHTTRCIPIIRTLKDANYDVVVAVCAKQKALLQHECTNVRFVDLEGYNISYASNKLLFILKIILQIPKILRCIYRENKWLDSYIKQNKTDLIISDNRYGFYSKKVKSIFITHQLQILAGNGFIENVLQKINYHCINKFNACWVPDFVGENNIAGKLSHPKKLPKTKVEYIGALSRFNNSYATTVNSNIEYDICVLLSGPEPQRTLLENKLLQQLHYLPNKKILLIRGLPQSTINIEHKHCTIKNHLQGKDLLQAINSSNIIVARSGYTTIMELIYLHKKIILIPTPMQTEQEYLAQYLSTKNICITYVQNEIDMVKAVEKAKVFNPISFDIKSAETDLLNLLTSQFCQQY